MNLDYDYSTIPNSIVSTFMKLARLRSNSPNSADPSTAAALTVNSRCPPGFRILNRSPVEENKEVFIKFNQSRKKFARV